MLLYRILTIVLSPVIFGHILWLSIKNKQGRYFWQRLGLNYSNLPTGCLWFHCASVGEVNTLLPLIKNIHLKNNRQNILITTNTITGAKIVKQQKLDYLFHSYLPFDWVNCINRFLKKVDPVAVYIMETEIWPNLLISCHKNRTVVTLINARLSRKTTSANAWIKSLLKHSLSKVNAIYARTDTDKAAYIKLGANKNNISTVGNLKLTSTLHNSTDNKDLFNIDREYILLASTHSNEELQIYNKWKELNRNELLIIAPRHPERSAAIVKQLSCKDITIRSKNQAIGKQTKVYLLDTVGELKNYFSNAQLVIMGGSFTPIGGHNILEPASFNSAIITGPHMENFKEELTLMLEKEAIIQVSSIDELTEALTKLLNDPVFKTTLQNNAAEISHNSQEILDNYMRLILPDG